jgi:hypothetical protein
MNLKVTVWHGEAHSLFYIYDDDKGVVASCRTRPEAEKCIADYNAVMALFGRPPRNRTIKQVLA